MTTTRPEDSSAEINPERQLGTVADDVPAELALATISAVEVLGAFRAPKEVKAALAGRIA